MLMAASDPRTQRNSRGIKREREETEQEPVLSHQQVAKAIETASLGSASSNDTSDIQFIGIYNNGLDVVSGYHHQNDIDISSVREGVKRIRMGSEHEDSIYSGNNVQIQHSNSSTEGMSVTRLNISTRTNLNSAGTSHQLEVPEFRSSSGRQSKYSDWNRTLADLHHEQQRRHNSQASNPAYNTDSYPQYALNSNAPSRNPNIDEFEAVASHYKSANAFLHQFSQYRH